MVTDFAFAGKQLGSSQMPGFVLISGRTVVMMTVLMVLRRSVWRMLRQMLRRMRLIWR
jgi:hypothetical protein